MSVAIIKPVKVPFPIMHYVEILHLGMVLGKYSFASSYISLLTIPSCNVSHSALAV